MCSAPHHSYRNANIGSIRVARLAGKYSDINATIAIASTANTTVTGSLGSIYTTATEPTRNCPISMF